MLQPGDKKALGVLGAVVAASLAIIVGATAFLVTGAEKPLPKVSVQAGDHLTRVEPGFWCSVTMDSCHGRDDQGKIKLRIYQHPVAVGEQVSVSVPIEVSDGPWFLTAEFATPRGVQREVWYHSPDTAFTQLLDSEPDRVLLGIDISPISAVYIEATPTSPDGDFLPRGNFAVNTSPDGYKVTNTTPLPDVRR
ncbi:DUF2771 family protein [Gordonia shandongensis]|uniref:DUF2771 family protein n=1 Tax=Gordonia shandongensis TaxID=376351 RepID=UPI0004028EB3|nr:DUF2771 family protein [Gordonia shandongensis]